MLSDLPPWLEEVKVTSAKEAGILLSCDTRDYGRKPISTEAHKGNSLPSYERSGVTANSEVRPFGSPTHVRSRVIHVTWK